MAKLIKIAEHKCICPTCDGNGYIRIAAGDTSKDFRDNSQVHQCWDCDSEGEFYEEIVDDLIDDSHSNKLH